MFLTYRWRHFVYYLTVIILMVVIYVDALHASNDELSIDRKNNPTKREERTETESAVGRGFLVQPCSSSSSIFNEIYKPSSGPASTFLFTSAPRHYRQIAVQAQQRPTWLPGLDPPPYLDGTLAGDYGFDPLGLGENPESLKRYVQAELVRARFAMAGVAGILFTDLLRVTGISNLPVCYPGGPLLNPLGLAKDTKNAHEWKLKERKNGRLAVIAMPGIFVQAYVTHAGPIDNLVEHLSNPWQKTTIQTLANSSS